MTLDDLEGQHRIKNCIGGSEFSLNLSLAFLLLTVSFQWT